MSPELLGIVAVGVLIAAAVYAFKPKRVSPINGYRPVSVIDAYDAAGREAAARYVDEALGRHRARRFAEDINAALNVGGPPPAPIAPPTAPPQPPNP